MPQWDPARIDPSAYPGPGIDLPVTYADLDTNGHLNNVALGRFFEHARATTFSQSGFWHAVHGGGGTSVVGRVAIDYLAEVYLFTTLQVRSRLLRIGTSSATIEQAAFRDGVAIGLAEVVFVHTKDGKAAPWPEEAVTVLREMGA
jgi:acyl-CoA thioester hydrolase